MSSQETKTSVLVSAWARIGIIAFTAVMAQGLIIKGFKQQESRYLVQKSTAMMARPDLLAFTAFPKQIWRQIWSNNPQERLNKEIRRRTDVVGIFPDRNALIRLVGAVLAEQHDEWAESRRYLGLDVLSKSRTVNDTPTEQEATPAALTA